jgi:ketosteroid isomerase-like protein
MRTLSMSAAVLAAMTLCACEEPPAPPAPTTPPKPDTSAAAKKEEPKPVKLTGEQRAQRIKDFFAAIDAGKMDTVKDFMAKDVKKSIVDHLPPMDATGPDAIQAMMKPMMAAFTEMKHETGIILVRGNEVVTVGAAHAKNTGEFGGKPATNKTLGIYFADWSKQADDGKTSEQKTYFDQNSMMGQLGLLPPEAGDHWRPAVEPGKLQPVIVVAKNDDKEKANLAAYDKVLEPFNKHDVDAVLANYTDDAVFRHNGHKEDLVGKEAMKKGLAGFFKMTSDVKITVDWKWAAGDYVASAGSETGTFDGESPDGKMKGTKKSWTTKWFGVNKFDGGKIKEEWLFSNGLKWAVDVGLAPDPSQMAKAEGEKKEGETKEAKEGTKKDDTKPTTAPTKK